MKCPVCKKIIPDDVLKCPYCNAEIKISHKGSDDLLHNNTQIELYEPRKYSQQEAIREITEILTQKSKKIISLLGDEGCGKNYILKESIKKLENQPFAWFFGKCTPFTQLTAGGLIQDIILNLFNLPNFSTDINLFKNNSTEFFKKEFSELTNSDIDKLISFLYPHQYGYFEDLIKNKNEFFDIFTKIINKIAQISDFVIVIDNFDLIDKFSQEFLNTLLQNQTLFSKAYILILSSKSETSSDCFNLKNKEIFYDITIGKFTQRDFIEFQKNFKEAFSYTNELEQKEIIKKSKGNPAFLEQALSLCFDCQLADIPFKLPNSIDELIQTRLINLKKTNPIAYKILLLAAILGDKINLSLLKITSKIDEKNLTEILEYLSKMQFIKPVNEIFFEFKSLKIWETILKTFKTDTDFLNLNRMISEILDNLVLNSNAIKSTISQNLWQVGNSLKIWTENASFASFIGDKDFYIISQRQCLALLNELDEKENLKIKNDIYEKLGKILSEDEPQEAMEFLTKIISNPDIINNETKQIEILSYISYCCTKIKNYYGNLECINKILEKVPAENKLQFALLKALKMPSLLAIGNCGEIINSADNDIIPVLDNFLQKPYDTNLSYSFVWNIWLKTYLYLANALVLQGNNRAFEILTIIFDIIERNKINDAGIICQSKLILALANTIKGDIYISGSILEDIITIQNTQKPDPNIILQLNLIKIFNKFLKGQYNNLQDEISKVIDLANTCDNKYAVNILKTLSGKIFEHNGDNSQALNIYNEQISYFAKEQAGLGALLTWYLIANVTIKTEGPHAAIEIAEQALSVAQNPKINNHIFAILLKSVIAQARMIITDYESAQINFENIITMASQFDLKDILARLYLQYGKYYHETGLLKTDKQTEFLSLSSQMYKKAYKIADNLKNDNRLKSIQTAQNELISFCELNNIQIKS